MKRVSSSLTETEEIAKDFLNFIVDKRAEKHSGNLSGAYVVGLSGNLGAGKTTFTQAIGRLLGIKETMTSPTFVIEKIYSIRDHPYFDKLVHIDAYRLSDGEELMKLNFSELAKDPRNLIFIEWPENVESALQTLRQYQKIYFNFIDEKSREIKY